MTLPFIIKAGASAKARLLAEGFSPTLFSAMLGASGGPKWFILSGLDRYLAAEFLPASQRPIDLLGSSVGGWRMAAHASDKPVEALTRFRDFYHHLTYSKNADAREISDSSRAMVQTLLAEQGAATIVNNPQRRLNIITAGCKGLVRFERKPVQLLGLGLAAAANLLSRRQLQHFFTRTVLHAGAKPHWFSTTDLPTEYLPLSTHNLAAALEATGAIPMALEGVTMPDSRQPLHRDGGIIDYHFDLPLQPDGLVLYPHFYDRAIPGWFDKSLRWRQPQAQHYDQVVMIAPSPTLVASLPYQKIADRKDFVHLDDKTRIAYWQAVIDASNRLADSFAASLKNDSWRQALL